MTEEEYPTSDNSVSGAKLIVDLDDLDPESAIIAANAIVNETDHVMKPLMDELSAEADSKVSIPAEARLAIESIEQLSLKDKFDVDTVVLQDQLSVSLAAVIVAIEEYKRLLEANRGTGDTINFSFKEFAAYEANGNITVTQTVEPYKDTSTDTSSELSITTFLLPNGVSFRFKDVRQIHEGGTGHDRSQIHPDLLQIRLPREGKPHLIYQEGLDALKDGATSSETSSEHYMDDEESEIFKEALLPTEIIDRLRLAKSQLEILSPVNESSGKETDASEGHDEDFTVSVNAAKHLLAEADVAVDTDTDMSNEIALLNDKLNALALDNYLISQSLIEAGVDKAELENRLIIVLLEQLPQLKDIESHAKRFLKIIKSINKKHWDRYASGYKSRDVMEAELTSASLDIAKIGLHTTLIDLAKILHVIPIDRLNALDIETIKFFATRVSVNVPPVGSNGNIAGYDLLDAPVTRSSVILSDLLGGSVHISYTDSHELTKQDIDKHNRERANVSKKWELEAKLRSMDYYDDIVPPVLTYTFMHVNFELHITIFYEPGLDGVMVVSGVRINQYKRRNSELRSIKSDAYFDYVPAELLSALGATDAFEVLQAIARAQDK